MRTGKLYGLVLLTAVVLGPSCDTPGNATRGEGVSQGNDSLRPVGTAPGERGGGDSKDYADPGGAFSIKLLRGWKVERRELDGAYMTVITSDEYRAANLSIMTINAAPPETTSADLQDRMLIETSQPYFEGWINSLKEQARVEGLGEVHRTRFGNVDAMRLDVSYYRGDGDDPRKGYGVYLLGQRTTFFISLTGARLGFAELEKMISTLDIEP